MLSIFRMQVYYLPTPKEDRLAVCVKIVDYKAQCGNPENVLNDVLSHCDIAIQEDLFRCLAKSLHASSYYQPVFNNEEPENIERIAGAV